MKRIPSILLALALVLGFSLVTATPVAAATLEVGTGKPYSTIQSAINAASAGDTITVYAGTYAGATVNKTALTIQANPGDVVTISDGPQHPAGFLRVGFWFQGFTGNGATIRGFRFAGTNQNGYMDDNLLDFAVFSRGADDVTVEDNVMTATLQAITNWHGDGWQIRDNQITDLWTLNGGGIGILIGANDGSTVQDNVVSDNQISGTLSVYSGDGGGYDGTGIVLYADFRVYSGGIVTNTMVSGNDISMVSDTPGVVNFNGIELTDTRDSDGNPASVYGNQVTQNDVLGSSGNGVLVSAGTTDNHINYNNIDGNQGYGVLYSGTGTLDATSNWWGANDGPGPVGPGSGDNVSINVDYSSWVQQTSTATGTGTVSFGPSAGTITGLTGVSESSLPAVAQATKPISFPNGLFSFNITGLSNGQAVNVTITLPVGSAPTQYWKYHVNEGGWVQIPMTIVGPANVIMIRLVDGGLGDDDQAANGVIVDQGGPGGGAVGWETYPISRARVLLPWIALLAAIMVGAGLLAMRRRRAQS